MNSKKIIKNFKDIKFPITKDEFIKLYELTKDNRYYKVNYDFSLLPDIINDKNETITLICLEKYPNGDTIGKCRTSFYQFMQLERDVNKYVKSRNEISEEEFIKRSKLYYGDNTFSYDKLKYTGWNNEIILKCNNCGEYFKITPRLHLLGYKEGIKNNYVIGCNNCNKEYYYSNNIDDIFKKSKINWFNKIKEKDLINYFDYSEVVYLGRNYPVKILCKTCNNYFFGKVRRNI